MRRIYSISTVLFLVLICFPAFLLAGSDIPSESDARTVFNNGFGGMFKINSFKKVNGLSGEVYGIKVYAIEYEAEIEQLEPPEESPSLLNLYFLDNHLGDMVSVKGTVMKLHGVLEFIRTENGWKGEDDKVY